MLMCLKKKHDKMRQILPFKRSEPPLWASSETTSLSSSSASGRKHFFLPLVFFITFSHQHQFFWYILKKGKIASLYSDSPLGCCIHIQYTHNKLKTISWNKVFSFNIYTYTWLLLKVHLVEVLLLAEGCGEAFERLFS